MTEQPQHVLLIDVDGLRPDVFANALEAGRLPHLAQLLGGAELERGLLYPVLAPAPSITFASQASLITGAHPSQHGIAGNQFFDRFGRYNAGEARLYAFDIGDTWEADDAIRVFTEGLADRFLEVPTLYEHLALKGRRSAVVGHMYGRGADPWLRPAVFNLARLTKGKGIFGLSAEEYDRRVLDEALGFLAEDGLPDLFLMYFMGVDHESHARGPRAQLAYLIDVIDPLVGELWEAVLASIRTPGAPAPLCAIFSDHGQIRMPEDDARTLRLAFPFKREIGHVFDGLGLDVHDFPGEDPHTEAVVASNGGMALVYLQKHGGRWVEPPGFEHDVLPVGRAFWEAHLSGRYASELQGSLAGVLVRDVEKHGWSAPYLALTSQGERLSLAEWFRQQPAGQYVDPVHRLNNLAGPSSGDLLLISNYADGFYFGGPMAGVHGGLHPEDSAATLALGWPGVPEGDWLKVGADFITAIQDRCQREGERQPATADLVTGLLAVLE